MLSRASRLAKRDVICRADNVTGTRMTSRGAIVGKLQDPKSRHSYLKKKKSKVSSLRFQSTSSSLSCSCTRDSHVMYVLRTILTRETIHTKDYTHRAKKKRNTIILYSRSAFCLQFHFNLLFVNLPSTLRKALHTCAQKKIQKRRHHFC